VVGRFADLGHESETAKLVTIFKNNVRSASPPTLEPPGPGSTAARQRSPSAAISAQDLIGQTKDALKQNVRSAVGQVLGGHKHLPSVATIDQWFVHRPGGAAKAPPVIVLPALSVRKILAKVSGNSG
jgi:hypothetical protein